jgi:hypothetical protein
VSVGVGWCKGCKRLPLKKKRLSRCKERIFQKTNSLKQQGTLENHLVQVEGGARNRRKERKKETLLIEVRGCLKSACRCWCGALGMGSERWVAWQPETRGPVSERGVILSPDLHPT